MRRITIEYLERTKRMEELDPKRKLIKDNNIFEDYWNRIKNKFYGE
jgi:hypothetical protein